MTSSVPQTEENPEGRRFAITNEIKSALLKELNGIKNRIPKESWDEKRKFLLFLYIPRIYLIACNSNFQISHCKQASNSPLFHEYFNNMQVIPSQGYPTSMKTVPLLIT